MRGTRKPVRYTWVRLVVLYSIVLYCCHRNCLSMHAIFAKELVYRYTLHPSAVILSIITRSA